MLILKHVYWDGLRLVKKCMVEAEFIFGLLKKAFYGDD